jgi:arylsulfatase A-like enzyme
VNVDGVVSAAGDERQATPSPSAAPPNFLFIITDDQDTYSIRAYRRSEPAENDSRGRVYVVDTPNIDRLAAEGMLFHQARLMGADSGAVCQPSRTCIMSGKNTWQRTSGVTAATTFPGVFNRGARGALPALPHATYRTCKVGNSYPLANGEFTIVNDATRRGNTDGSGSEWHAERGLDYIDHWRTNHRPNGRPFLIYLGFSHPHDTRMARTSPDLAGRYHCFNATDPASIVLDPLAPPLPANHLPAHPFDHGHLNVRDEVSVSGIGSNRSEAVVRNEIGRNLACVDWIDRQLGRVLARLEDPDGDGDPADSVIDNTYIVFTSDHGIAIGRHGLQGKQNLYEHTWRVPYIVRGPGIAPGSESDALVYLHDSFPTFCDLAGIEPPATIDGNDGRSFRHVLLGSSDRHREVLYGLYAGGAKPGMRAVTDGRFKLIKYDVGNNATQVTQLFDLENNPFELLPEHGVPNLADQPAYAGVRRDLEELLMRQRVENADPYRFLGDRTLLRFEDGAAGEPAGLLADRLPFGNDGSARSGSGGDRPAFSDDTPSATDFVAGEPNTRSLRLEADQQQHVLVDDAPTLDFGSNPFTIEAWVKLASLPAGPDPASTMPVAMKKVIGSADSSLDYLFLAAAGHYGGATSYRNLALHLGGTPIISSLAIPDTGWHHISVAYDPVEGVVRFTLDQQADTRRAGAAGTSNAGPLVIGAHFNSSGVIDSSFDGLIDELSITDGFLAVSELQPLAAVAPPSPFRITAARPDPAGDRVELTFESDPTRLYTVQRSTTLLPGAWTDLVTHLPGAAGSDHTTVDELPVDPAARHSFFRVLTSDGL